MTFKTVPGIWLSGQIPQPHAILIEADKKQFSLECAGTRLTVGIDEVKEMLKKVGAL